MTEKIKVPKEIAEVVEKLRSEDEYDTITRLLSAFPLKKSASILAVKAFLDGYEVELDPKEQWALNYQSIACTCKNEAPHRYREGYLSGYAEGQLNTIRQMNRDFNLQIKYVEGENNGDVL